MQGKGNRGWEGGCEEQWWRMTIDAVREALGGRRREVLVSVEWNGWRNCVAVRC